MNCSLESAESNAFGASGRPKSYEYLIARQGNTTVFLRAGHHDAVYDLANKSAFVVPEAGEPGLVAITSGVTDLDGEHLGGLQPPTASSQEPAGPSRSLSTGQHQNSRMLDSILRRSNGCAQPRQTRCSISGLTIDENSLELVLELTELTPEAWANRSLLENEDAADERFRTAIVERGALSGLSSVLTASEGRATRSSTYRGMDESFFTQTSGPLVKRSSNGPARVRGSAGTGKTVVALHRAAALVPLVAEVPPSERKPVLFTTFVNNLPPVFENLYERLPTAVSGVVEFTNVDKLARQICVEAGHTPTIDPQAVNSHICKGLRRSSRARHATPCSGANPELFARRGQQR